MIATSACPKRAAAGIVVAAAGLLVARDGAAHIDLEQPVPREVGSSREPNSNLKQGPCGQVEDGRTTRVSVFAPGETIDVTWRETINHRGYYRIAFDRDGDDAFPTFAGPGRGASPIDPRDLCPVDGQVILAYDLEDGNGGTHTARVTLPDVECERCTLQVVQYMFDTNNPYYFQCADLALRRSGPRDAGAASDALDASLGDAAADATAPEPRAAPGCSARIAPLDAGRSAPGRDDASDPPAPRAPAADGDRSPVDAPATGGAPSETPAPRPAHDSGGCTMGAAPANPGSFAGGWLAAVVAAAWRRSRGTVPWRRARRVRS